jgi:hypothetical protein
MKAKGKTMKKLALALTLIGTMMAPATHADSFDFDAVKAKGEKKKDQTLVFKGFYLGMPAPDAQALLNHYLKLEQVGSEPAEPPKLTPEQAQAKLMGALFGAALGVREEPKGPFRIYKADGKLLVQRTPDERPFAVAGADGAVIEFEISETLRNKLFDSANMPINEFLQNFINAYDIPSLDASRVELNAQFLGLVKKVGFQNILQHRSPKGFEITYWDDPVILDDENAALVSTKPANTITIFKIETAKQRESKFD